MGRERKEEANVIEEKKEEEKEGKNATGSPRKREGEEESPPAEC